MSRATALEKHLKGLNDDQFFEFMKVVMHAAPATKARVIAQRVTQTEIIVKSEHGDQDLFRRACEYAGI